MHTCIRVHPHKYEQAYTHKKCDTGREDTLSCAVKPVCRDNPTFDSHDCSRGQNTCFPFLEHLRNLLTPASTLKLDTYGLPCRLLCVNRCPLFQSLTLACRNQCWSQHEFMEKVVWRLGPGLQAYKCFLRCAWYELTSIGKVAEYIYKGNRLSAHTGLEKVNSLSPPSPPDTTLVFCFLIVTLLLSCHAYNTYFHAGPHLLPTSHI